MPLSPRQARRWPTALLLAVITACEFGTLPPGVAPADAVKFSYLCADSFQISNRLLRADGSGLLVDIRASWPVAAGHAGSITTRLHVPWAKSANEAGLLTFRLAIPKGIPVEVSAQPTIDPPNNYAVPSLTLPTGASVTCGAPLLATVRLRQAIGLGASGSITPAGDSLPSGTRISWSFKPVDGASGVEVRLGGNILPASGSALVTQETTFSAVGIFPHTPSPEIAPLVTQARALLASPAPQLGAQKLLNDLVALLDQVDEATGDRLLDDFQAQLLTSDADADAAIRLDSLLGNTLLHVDIPNRPSLRQGEEPFPGEPTTYFVAAGILTSQEKVAATARIVRTLIRDRSMLGPNDLIRSFVSPSMSGLSLDIRRCVARIFSFSGIRDRINGFLTFCLPLYGGILDSNDFLEASSQILKQWLGGIPSRQTSLAFLDSLQHYRDLGYHIITDAHSQGTLIAREAITELSNRGLYRPASDSTCLGVVAMAGPVSGNWPMPLAYFREFATEGDIVAATGGSQAVRVPTDLTRQRDSALASINKFNFPLRMAVSLMYGVQLHDLQSTYLGEAPPRNYLLAANDQIRRECETKEIRSAIGDRYQISKGEEFPIGLYFTSYNYNGHPLSRPLPQIVSEQPAIAQMISNVTLLGKEIGDATIVATSGSQRAAVTVAVRPPPLLGIGGSYAGQWSITQPTVTGALALTMSESGSVTKNGEPQIAGSVTYTYAGESYTAPMQQGKVSLGGVYPTLTFTMATPEFSSPDAWASVSLEIHPNGGLSGGATLYLQSGLVRESRGWNLARSAP